LARAVPWTETTPMTLNVALVGYGYVGKTFHAPLIAATSGLQLVAVGSSNPVRVSADLPAVHVGGYHEVLVRPDVDLVVIATPNDTHHELARLALSAGKHVVVDKPLTVAVHEAQDLRRLAQTSGRLLSSCHFQRWSADFLTVRRLIDDGRLGRVVHFESHYDRYRPEVPHRWRDLAGRGAGIWFDLGPHLIDQTLQLFGPPQALQADMALLRAGAKAVDYFHVMLRYEGRRVILHGSNLVAGGSPRFVIHGTAASYVKHGVDPQEPALRRGERPGGPGWGRDELDGVLHVADTGPETVPTVLGDWRVYYADVRDAIVRQAPNPVSPDDVVAMMAVLELGVQSAERGCELDVDPTP
jgi:predicted dehydrogenase